MPSSPPTERPPTLTSAKTIAEQDQHWVDIMKAHMDKSVEAWQEAVLTASRSAALLATLESNKITPEAIAR